MNFETFAEANERVTEGLRQECGLLSREVKRLGKVHAESAATLNQQISYLKGVISDLLVELERVTSRRCSCGGAIGHHAEHCKIWSILDTARKATR